MPPSLTSTLHTNRATNLRAPDASLEVLPTAHRRIGRFLFKSSDCLFKRKDFLDLAAQAAHGNGAVGGLAGADHQENGHLGDTVFAHLEVDLFVAHVEGTAQASRGDGVVNLARVIVGIVGNDAAWGQMARPQVQFYGADRLVATKLNYTRYDQIVEAMGGHGEYCERPEEIGPALERAFASGKPALVNVVMRQDIDTGMKGSTYM